ncbi:ALG6, ALG8 glycosyltransferase family-domain-containing protein [Crepidotus variabilis]|uniref:dolichyl-P-Glc:Man9GlcNAc2-PP-dolichol alpha-1,3-glucosyltransferase n=1 Tax=Crepidotus variabilis TaxID=179855 RepID=A0A9P6JUM9_9AGAR|nr:ALG6, ALG8 glycosyltransferase family-domain-containing protein [Crepidotus variabilis]
MDELSALPPEVPSQQSAKRLSRQQHRYATSSARSASPLQQSHIGVGGAGPNGAPGAAHAHAHQPQRPPGALSVNTTVAQANGLVILAPTPRRHLIESSASQHWLHTPPFSPSPPSSRPGSVSPLTQPYLNPNHNQQQFSAGPSTSGYPFPYPSHSNFSPAASSSQRQRTGSGSVSPNVPRRRRISSATNQSIMASPLMQPKRFNELIEEDVPGSTQHHQSQRRPKGLVHVSSSSSLRSLRGSVSRSVYSSTNPHSTHPANPDPAHPPTSEHIEPSLARRYIRYMHKSSLHNYVLPSLISFALLIRLMITLSSYSGMNSPPMYGDYEAQRHWMEITKHLPMKEWYWYDLPYWGLDYPPLTAYVSWLCGFLGHAVNPSWVALSSSRGMETPGSKVFMRLSVVALDALIYIPALIMFSRTWQGSRSKRTQELVLLTLLLQPALLLIDFGHFQYNSVMLGLTLLAINFFAIGLDTAGAFCFVLSLGFKQMALYYAPAIGSYLLAKCIYLGPIRGTRLFSRLAVITLSTFILLFLPWLPPFSPINGILQPLHRIFPFARGLFEDKVANFWCASNVVFKWKSWASRSLLVRLSTAGTALGFMPGVVGILRAGWVMKRTEEEVGLETKSTKEKDDKYEKAEKESVNAEPTPFLPLLPYALLTSSMSFFLFSFQVHEKTILLPLMPMTLLLSGANVDSAVYHWGVLANNVGVFSMWPLLKRDGLGVQYIAMLLLWNRLIGYNPVRLRPASFIQVISMAVYTAALLVHILELFFEPPTRYPDLYPVLNVLISTPVFGLVWLWSIKCGVELGWALGGIGKSSREHGNVARKENLSQDSVAASPVVGASSGNEFGSYRQGGGRAVSLGYGQARQRIVNAGGILGSGGVTGEE